MLVPSSRNGFVAGFVGFCLLKLRLIRARVDDGEDVADLDVLTFLKFYLLNFAVDPDLYRYCIERLHGPQTGAR